MRESGAFLLGTLQGNRRAIKSFVFYDDLDPRCLDTGIIRFSGSRYPNLWNICAVEQLVVVGDVHTHPGPPFQSSLDRDHPMIAKAGHVALITPNFAREVVGPRNLGIYEYVAAARWMDHSGVRAGRFFYLGFWG